MAKSVATLTEPGEGRRKEQGTGWEVAGPMVL